MFCRGAFLLIFFIQLLHSVGAHIQILFFLISGFVVLWMDVQQERTAGTKVLASLLASEDSVLKEIAPYIEDARRAVATVANMDSSPQLRALCEQLLACMTKTD
jgi:hypothetical protein